MPVFNISTNLKRDQIPDTFLKEASKLIASVLGKPEMYVIVQVNPDQLMTFGGTDEPCANISLSSIGSVDSDNNKKFAPKLSKFIEQTLGIKQNRFYIVIHDLPAAFVVWNGNLLG